MHWQGFQTFIFLESNVLTFVLTFTFLQYFVFFLLVKAILKLVWTILLSFGETQKSMKEGGNKVIITSCDVIIQFCGPQKQLEQTNEKESPLAIYPGCRAPPGPQGKNNISFTQNTNLGDVNLVPRGCIPFGQHQGCKESVAFRSADRKCARALGTRLR